MSEATRHEIFWTRLGVEGTPWTTGPIFACRAAVQENEVRHEPEKEPDEELGASSAALPVDGGCLEIIWVRLPLVLLVGRVLGNLAT